MGMGIKMKKLTAKEIREAWLNFKPEVPLKFLVARIKAQKEKNRQK